MECGQNVLLNEIMNTRCLICNGRKRHTVPSGALVEYLTSSGLLASKERADRITTYLTLALSTIQRDDHWHCYLNVMSVEDSALPPVRFDPGSGWTVVSSRVVLGTALTLRFLLPFFCSCLFVAGPDAFML